MNKDEKSAQFWDLAQPLLLTGKADVSVQLVKTGSTSELTGSKEGGGKPRC